jgi:hypothetical protein
LFTRINDFHGKVLEDCARWASLVFATDFIIFGAVAPTFRRAWRMTKSTRDAGVFRFFGARSDPKKLLAKQFGFIDGGPQFA